MKVVDLSKVRNRSVNGLIKSLIRDRKEIDQTIILQLMKDGSLWIRSTDISGMEKEYLRGLFNWYCNSAWEENNK